MRRRLAQHLTHLFRNLKPKAEHPVSQSPETPTDTPWWDRNRHADRRPLLLARNRIQAALRLWLADHDFTEVDPAGLQTSPGNEAHLHAFATDALADDGSARRMYLHTSPEFAMKKLLAAGERRIFSFAHVWRNRERGARHSPEFTMLEWYRVGEPYEVLMDDTLAFLRLAAGGGTLRHRDMICDPAQEPQRLSVAEAFRLYAGIDLLSTLDGAATDRDALAAQAVAAGLRVAGDDVWSDIFSRVLSERVEPHLGQGRITILDRYPAAEAALARVCADDAREAERFEVYACGVELANGFGELTNPTCANRMKIGKDSTTGGVMRKTSIASRKWRSPRKRNRASA